MPRPNPGGNWPSSALVHAEYYPFRPPQPRRVFFWPLHFLPQPEPQLLVIWSSSLLVLFSPPVNPYEFCAAMLVSNGWTSKVRDHGSERLAIKIHHLWIKSRSIRSIALDRSDGCDEDASGSRGEGVVEHQRVIGRQSISATRTFRLSIFRVFGSTMRWKAVTWCEPNERVVRISMTWKKIGT